MDIDNTKGNLKLRRPDLKHKIHFNHRYAFKAIKLSYHHPFFHYGDRSTPNLSMVIKGHTIKATPLSIKTLATVILLHFTILCRDLICPVSFSISSSSMEVMMLVANTCPTICSSSLGLVLVGIGYINHFEQRIFMCLRTRQ